VNPHPRRKFGVLLERFGNLERASSRFLGAVAEDQRHSIASRQPNELFVGRVAHLRRPEDDFRQLAEVLLLPFDQELRVTDEVDEEDMPDLEFGIGGLLGRHEVCLYLKTRDLTSLFEFKTSHSPTATL
jgi:hypothetical protein